MSSFLSGAIMMASLVVAGFFGRFWQKGRDRLFLLLSIAFCLMSIERWVLQIFNPGNESKPYIYLIRLGAFIVIMAGVVDKNRRSGRGAISGESDDRIVKFRGR